MTVLTHFGKPDETGVRKNHRNWGWGGQWPPKGTQDKEDCHAHLRGAGHTWRMDREQTGKCEGCALPDPPACYAHLPGARLHLDTPAGSGPVIDCGGGTRGWTPGKPAALTGLSPATSCRSLLRAPRHPVTCPALPARGSASWEPTLGGRSGTGILSPRPLSTPSPQG